MEKRKWKKNFEISNEQKEMCNEVIKYCKGIKWESNTFSKDLWDKLVDLGIFGICVPAQYGGLEENYFTAALLTEAIGYACDNNGLIFAMNNHIWVAIELIRFFWNRKAKKGLFTGYGERHKNWCNGNY